MHVLRMCDNQFFGRCADLHLCVELQIISLEHVRSPPQITTFIKQQEQIATGLTRGPHTEAGLTSFCASMEGLLSRSGLRTDYIHFAAMITAAAHIWKEAQRSPRFRGYADVSERLKALFQRCLHLLQGLLADMGAREISNVLWSSATLSMNPDDDVPGLVHALTSRFLYFIGMDEEKQRPTAQATANVLWAFATIGHPAATRKVVAALCSHFGTLAQDQDARQRPKAQECANAMWALARLGDSSAAAKEMVDPVCLHFGQLVESPSAQPRPTSQAVANLVWALGTFEHTPPDHRLLDGLCNYMRDLLYSRDRRTHPNAQEVANFV